MFWPHDPSAHCRWVKLHPVHLRVARSGRAGLDSCSWRVELYGLLGPQTIGTSGNEKSSVVLS